MYIFFPISCLENGVTGMFNRVHHLICPSFSTWQDSTTVNSSMFSPTLQGTVFMNQTRRMYLFTDEHSRFHSSIFPERSGSNITCRDAWQ